MMHHYPFKFVFNLLNKQLNRYLTSRLFNIDFNCFDCTATNERIIANDNGKTLKIAVVAYVKVLSRNSSEETRKNSKYTQPE
jgi:hypothetical protein